jgi:ribosomal protein S18 acetylase RimI-like enzyme
MVRVENLINKVYQNVDNNKIVGNGFLIENLNFLDSNIKRKVTLVLEQNEGSKALIPLLNMNFKNSSHFIPKIIGNIGKDNTKLLLDIASNKDEKIRVRRYAVEGLGRIGEKSILKDLYILLKSENIYIKKSVILAIAYIKDKTSVEILLNQLEKEGNWIKKDIIWALGIIGENQSVNKLVKMLSIKNLEFKIRKNIVNALGNIGDKRAVDVLITVLNDDYSGLQDYTSFALAKIGDKRAIHPLIKKYLDPMWFSKEHYEKLLNKLAPRWRYLLKDYDYKIYRREDLPQNFFENIKSKSPPEDWHYGYLNKTHYILNGFNKIIGCLNLIFLSIYNDTYLFYLDTIEIKESYRRRQLGTHFTEFIIKNELERYKKYIVLLLVAKCEQYKLKFFSSLGFLPVLLRKTQVGTHCIMSFPFDKNSEKLCQRLFEYFNWREEKKEYVYFDCKYAYNPNPTGLYWCAKKRIYVSGCGKQSCKFYVKGKEIFNEKKFLDLKLVLSKNL